MSCLASPGLQRDSHILIRLYPSDLISHTKIAFCSFPKAPLMLAWDRPKACRAVVERTLYLLSIPIFRDSQSGAVLPKSESAATGSTVQHAAANAFCQRRQLHHVRVPEAGAARVALRIWKQRRQQSQPCGTQSLLCLLMRQLRQEPHDQIWSRSRHYSRRRSDLCCTHFYDLSTEGWGRAPRAHVHI